MVFRRRKAEGGGDAAALRLYYASDIHGTEVLWLKFLNAPKHYKARVLVMGGDVTGKMVIPLVEDPPGVFTGQLFGRSERASDEAAAGDARAAHPRQRHVPVPHERG